MKRPDLAGDCSRCAALCCIAYAAEAGPGFAASKAAGEACPNLGADGMCAIYDRRADAGFSGCLSYDCFGAGQHVVQELYGGTDWRSDPALLSPMLETFRIVRKACELLCLVDHARRRALSGPQRELLDGLDRQLLEISNRTRAEGTGPLLQDAESRLRRLFAELGR